MFSIEADINRPCDNLTRKWVRTSIDSSGLLNFIWITPIAASSVSVAARSSNSFAVASTHSPQINSSNPLRCSSPLRSVKRAFSRDHIERSREQARVSKYPKLKASILSGIPRDMTIKANLEGRNFHRLSISSNGDMHWASSIVS